MARITAAACCLLGDVQAKFGGGALRHFGSHGPADLTLFESL